MYQGYHITFILLCYCLSVSGLDKCDIICDTKGCRKETVDLGLDKCTNEDIQTIPNNFNFTTKDGEPSVYPASLEIIFIPPKSECMSKVTLLANESINETECETRDLQNLNRTEVHTSEKRICFGRNTAPVLNISYQHIFTACYAVQFSSFSHEKIEKYTLNKFLKTNYKRTTIAIPQLECTYQSIGSNETTEEILHFEVDVTVSLVSELNLGLGLIDYSTGQENCDVYGDAYELKKNWSFNISEIYYEFKNNTSGNSTSMQNRGKYRKLISFDTKHVQNRSYCFYVNINDARCEDDSLWKPSYKRCKDLYPMSESDQEKLEPDTSNYMYWVIIATSLTGLIIFMTVSFVYLVNKHIWKKHNKSNLLNVSKDKDTLVMRTDIVLLYPKGSEYFMSLMAELRELLSRACQCSVYDWYNATECNYVAEMGGCGWFAAMLNKGCRIIWIDTPASRSLIAKKFKSRLLVKNSKEFDEICDFRDLAFTAIFDFAKHNIEQLHTDTKHNNNFIVRLKGFEVFDNEKDPFRCLHPDTCYIVPEDLSLLCSKLSLVKSSDEDNFIELWPLHSDRL